MEKKQLTKIAIVGRPNVGKSSLFNTIIGTRRAIVEPASGTTRDRLYADIKWKNKRFTIIDTGGFEESKGDNIPSMVLRQLVRAIEEADVIFFVTDGAAGIHSQDIELSDRIRKTSKKVYLLVNKIDDKASAWRAGEFFKLGLGEAYAVSAVNDIGIDDILDDAVKNMADPSAEDDRSAVSVAIVGRPNVGKSSYLNAILKEERAIVHHVAGTTRDSLDTDFVHKGKNLRLIDTAGIRHNPKIERAADFYGSVRSREAIKRADVTIVIIDGLDGMREDDERVIDFCLKEGKGLILVVNKWDLVKSVEMSKYKEMLSRKMSAIRNYPVAFVSAKTTKNVAQSMDLIWSIYEKANKFFSADELSEILAKLNSSREVRNRRVKFEYLKQSGATPPKFVIGMKNPKLVNDSLRGYAENFLRTTQDFEGVPIKVSIEKRLAQGKK